MRKIIMALILIGINESAFSEKLTSLTTSPEVKTLMIKTTEGQEVPVQLLKFNQKTSVVEIKETDGTKKKLNLSTFSPESQLYIKDWHSTLSLLNKRKLRITMTKKSNGKNTYEGTLGANGMFPNNGYEERWKTVSPGLSYEEVYYEIAIRSQAETPLNDIKVEYCIYHESEIEAEEKLYTNTMGKTKYDKEVDMHEERKLPKRVILNTINGECLIPKLPARGKTTEQTKVLWIIKEGEESKIEKAAQQSKRAQANKNSTTYHNVRRSLEGSLLGIRYRVYLPMTTGEYVMKEFASPLKLISKTEWPEK